MCKFGKISFSVILCNFFVNQMIKFNNFSRLYGVTATCWGFYFIIFGLFFKYSSFFYNDDDVPISICIMENFLDFLCLMLIVSLIINMQTLPIAAMVLLESKLEVLSDEFKNLKYHSEVQFIETISKLVEYHESLLK